MYIRFSLDQRAPRTHSLSLLLQSLQIRYFSILQSTRTANLRCQDTLVLPTVVTGEQMVSSDRGLGTNLVLIKLQSSPEAMFKVMFRYAGFSEPFCVCSLKNRQLTGSY